MLKKTITYTDYDGVLRTEDFYFGLNKAEVIEMQTMTEGGFTERINKAVKAEDKPAVMRIFKDLLLKTVGRKSEDGKLFKKSAEISAEFEASPAYEQLFMELVTNAEVAKTFMEKVMPPLTPEQQAQVDEEIKKLTEKKN